MAIGAFHVHEDTLATAVVSGSAVLTGTRAQLDLTSLLPQGWVSALELRVYGSGNWIFASANDNDAECPGPDGIWYPFPLINAHEKLWFRGAGVELFFAVFGKAALEMT